MVEPFCSIYTKSYRAYEKNTETGARKPCLFYEELQENFLPFVDVQNRDEAVIKELYLKRLQTTYQVSYCSSAWKNSLVIDPNHLDEDQFMVYFNTEYAKKTSPMPRPLDTARRIHGYTRYERYYTGKSEYRDGICREGYKFLKEDFDNGISRLYAKKQELIRERKRAIEQQKKAGEEVIPVEKPKEEIQKPSTHTIKEGEKGDPVKERICALCCEKFGDFSYKPTAMSSEETAAS